MVKFDLVKELNDLTARGYSPSLVNDDEGNWYLSDTGIQEVGEKISEICVVTDNEDAWKPTIEEAVKYFLENVKK